MDTKRTKNAADVIPRRLSTIVLVALLKTDLICHCLQRKHCEDCLTLTDRERYNQRETNGERKREREKGRKGGREGGRQQDHTIVPVNWLSVFSVFGGH